MSHTEVAPTTQGILATWSEIRDFVFAGNATFTLESRKTGVRFTYRIRVKKEDVASGSKDPTYFVGLLSGPDNESDYRYMGVARQEGVFNFTQASKVTRAAPSAKALVWFFDRMYLERDVAALLTVWHEGRCGRCGRTLRAETDRTVQRGQRYRTGVRQGVAKTQKIKSLGGQKTSYNGIKPLERTARK